jgi:hypothetical protein
MSRDKSDNWRQLCGYVLAAEGICPVAKYNDAILTCEAIDLGESERVVMQDGDWALVAAASPYGY